MNALDTGGAMVQDTFHACPHPILALGPVFDAGGCLTDFAILTANHALGVFLDRPGLDFTGCLMRRDLPMLGSYGLFEVYATALQRDRPMQVDLYLEERGKWVEVALVRNPQGLVATITDVTEKKRVEQQLKSNYVEQVTLNRALRQSNHHLQQFASTASHDLQEPLRKILLFSQLLKDKYGPDLQEGGLVYIDKILRSALRTQSLITDVLAYASLPTQGVPFERTSLKNLLADILEDLELVIREKKARIFLFMGPLPDADVLPGQIRQVFQNILGNALKFTRDDVPPVLRISADLIARPAFDAPALELLDPGTALSERGTFVRIRFCDNGIGFDPQYAGTIFDLFQRLHSKDKYEGTGIGLAITKKIVEAHGGMITARGREGEGAEFTLLLPLRHRA
ncbi:phospho-acceptor domain-containing protein [Dinghuibacter silviterrae]|uniref:histidine kinase n=2 Tax=Dinghuibacter silviterrae TaxID=1539049 RepID=A0A4V3GM19_9BACT|nr:phospho-acceptor domain-containing protein [Dinghuibacter silviterrae]